MKKILILCIFFWMSDLLAQQKAPVGIKLEPYAGYFQGNVSLTGASSSYGADTGTVKSYYAGGRFGYSMESGIALGVDYGLGRSGELTLGNYDYDYEASDLGAFFSYRLSSYIKAHATYIFQHEAKVSGAGPATPIDSTWKGDGYNVGVSLVGIPHISISLEYQTRIIRKADATTLPGENKSETYLLRLSLPMNFPVSMIPGAR